MSVCTKCGYPAGNHPFRHPFAPVVAAAPKPLPPAQESPYVPLDCGVGDIDHLRQEIAEAWRLLKDMTGVKDSLLRMILDGQESWPATDAIRAAAVVAERERCAKVVETYSNSEHAVDRILAEIRNPKGAR